MTMKKRQASSPGAEQVIGPNHDSPRAFPMASVRRWGGALARFNSFGPCQVRLRKSHPYNWICHPTGSWGQSRSGAADAMMSEPVPGRILRSILRYYTLLPLAYEWPAFLQRHAADSI